MQHVDESCSLQIPFLSEMGCSRSRDRDLGIQRWDLFTSPTQAMSRLGGYPVYYSYKNQANKKKIRLVQKCLSPENWDERFTGTVLPPRQSGPEEAVSVYDSIYDSETH